MLRLCIDTSYKYLSCCLIEDGKLIGAYDAECFKKQSEQVFVVLDQMFKQTSYSAKDIDSVCVAIGPGSYTGVRIALTVAKVLSVVKDIDLYTISTLRLYANNLEKAMVVLNARSDRAYVGVYDKGNNLLEDQVKIVSEIDINGYTLIGDGNLFSKEDYMPKVSECFLNNLEHMEKCEDKNHLVPVYLKESESYLK